MGERDIFIFTKFASNSFSRINCVHTLAFKLILLETSGSVVLPTENKIRRQFVFGKTVKRRAYLCLKDLGIVPRAVTLRIATDIATPL